MTYGYAQGWNGGGVPGSGGGGASVPTSSEVVVTYNPDVPSDPATYTFDNWAEAFNAAKALADEGRLSVLQYLGFNCVMDSGGWAPGGLIIRGTKGFTGFLSVPDDAYITEMPSLFDDALIRPQSNGARGREVPFFNMSGFMLYYATGNTSFLLNSHTNPGGVPFLADLGPGDFLFGTHNDPSGAIYGANDGNFGGSDLIRLSGGQLDMSFNGAGGQWDRAAIDGFGGLNRVKHDAGHEFVGAERASATPLERELTSNAIELDRDPNTIASAQALEQTTNVGTAFVDKISMPVVITPELEGELFELEWSYSVSVDSTTQDLRVRVLLDGAPLPVQPWEHRQEPQDAGGTNAAAGTDQQYTGSGRRLDISLLAGTYVFSLEHAASGGGTTECSMSNATMTLKRRT